MAKKIIAYKGFDKDMKCRGFQFEEGKTYQEETAELCESGFHACTMPLDVLGYYPPGDGSIYREVELCDLSDDRHIDDSKVCAKTIKIGAEIGIPGLVKAQIEWVKKEISFDAAIEKANKSSSEHATGDLGAASATGYQGAASATGKGSVALAAGKDCKVKGAIGCAIFAVERGEWNGSTYPIISVSAAIVDGEKIKGNTWYTLENDDFVEVSE